MLFHNSCMKGKMRLLNHLETQYPYFSEFFWLCNYPLFVPLVFMHIFLKDCPDHLLSYCVFIALGLVRVALLTFHWPIGLHLILPAVLFPSPWAPLSFLQMTWEIFWVVLIQAYSLYLVLDPIWCLIVSQFFLLDSRFAVNI